MTTGYRIENFKNHSGFQTQIIKVQCKDPHIFPIPKNECEPLHSSILERQFIHWKPLHSSAATICAISLAALYSVTLIALPILGVALTTYTVYKIHQHVKKKRSSGVPLTTHTDYRIHQCVKKRVLDPTDKKPQEHFADCPTDKNLQEPLGPLLPPRNPLPFANPIDKLPNLPPRDVQIKLPAPAPVKLDAFTIINNAIEHFTITGHLDEVTKCAEEYSAPTNEEIGDDEWNYEDETDLEQCSDTLALYND